MSILSVIPSLFRGDWWDTLDYRPCIMDQCFGLELFDEDLLPPSAFRGMLVRPRTQANIAASGSSEVKKDDTRFEISLNVSQFKPEELEVKIVDNFIVIHGKHEEKSDDQGFVSREFRRRYMLPRNSELDMVTSSLSPAGVLTISAPIKVVEDIFKGEKNVPISKEEAEPVENRNESLSKEETKAAEDQSIPISKEETKSTEDKNASLSKGQEIPISKEQV